VCDHERERGGLRWAAEPEEIIIIIIIIGKKLVKCYFRSIALYGFVTWAHGKVGQKYLDSLEIRCWRRVE
jgi:hypothetical protein